MDKMNVLSLFDGISCGRLALERAGVEVNNYYASEIDKYALKVSEANWSNIIRLGDVTQIDFDSLPKVDLLIGGSPCQSFSLIGKQKGFEDARGNLFFCFFDALHVLRSKNPDIKFLFENVKMAKANREIITEYLGVNPVRINSDLVSAQSRDRFYWANFDIKPIEDRTIMFSELFGEKPMLKNKGVWSYRAIDKSTCLDANYGKGIDNHGQRTSIEREKLTPEQCEILQTLPKGYTVGVSNTQRYKMIGNAWTVDLIAEIFENLKEVNNG